MVTFNIYLNGTLKTLALNGRSPLTMEDVRDIIRRSAGAGGWWQFAHSCIEFERPVSHIAPEHVAGEP